MKRVPRVRIPRYVRVHTRASQKPACPECPSNPGLEVRIPSICLAWSIAASRISRSGLVAAHGRNPSFPRCSEADPTRQVQSVSRRAWLQRPCWFGVALAASSGTLSASALSPVSMAQPPRSYSCFSSSSSSSSASRRLASSSLVATKTVSPASVGPLTTAHRPSRTAPS
jgi:hypothetical protein